MNNGCERVTTFVCVDECTCDFREREKPILPVCDHWNGLTDTCMNQKAIAAAIAAAEQEGK
jgi:hypothetical protein